MADKNENRGPDNNKRLASLEGQVATLAALLAGVAGFALAAGEEPIAGAIRLIDERGERIAGLEADAGSLEAALGEFATEGEVPADTLKRILGELTALRAADNSAAGASAGEIAAIARAEAAEDALKAAEAKIGEHEQTIAELSADPKGRAVKRASPKARKVSPTKRLKSEALHELMAEAGTFEVVLCTNGAEILEFAPVEFTNAAFNYAVGSFQLLEPLSVRGSVNAITVHGAALFYEGEQIAYSELPSPVVVPANGERRFERSILFAAPLAPKPVEPIE